MRQSPSEHQTGQGPVQPHRDDFETGPHSKYETRPHKAASDERGPRFIRFQRMTIVNGILAFVIIMVILQLWLLTATMNAYLGGETTILLPAALVSLACLALNAGLLWYLYRLER